MTEIGSFEGTETPLADYSLDSPRAVISGTKRISWPSFLTKDAPNSGAFGLTPLDGGSTKRRPSASTEPGRGWFGRQPKPGNQNPSAGWPVL